MNPPDVFTISKGNPMADVINSRGLTRAHPAPAAAGALTRLAAAFAVWRQRRALAELPEHLRRDVGLSETEITREAQRPLWDVPAAWRH
jgi:uncharacterized protein YjiS (DUF1127 family)